MEEGGPDRTNEILQQIHLHISEMLGIKYPTEMLENRKK